MRSHRSISSVDGLRICMNNAAVLRLATAPLLGWLHQAAAAAPPKPACLCKAARTGIRRWDRWSLCRCLAGGLLHCDTGRSAAVGPWEAGGRAATAHQPTASTQSEPGRGAVTATRRTATTAILIRRLVAVAQPCPPAVRPQPRHQWQQWQ